MPSGAVKSFRPVTRSQNSSSERREAQLMCGTDSTRALLTFLPSLVMVSSSDHPLEEGQLFRSVRDGIKIELSEIEAKVVLKAVLNGRIVRNTRRQPRAESRKCPCRVRDQELERGVTIENTSKDETSDGLSESHGQPAAERSRLLLR